MGKLTRRELLALGAAYGAVVADRARAGTSPMRWTERRDLYPHGVASGDPHADSVILWTRRPPVDGSEAKVLNMEIASDAEFHHVVARAEARVSAATDWTCRVLATGLKPSHVYWYRFADEHGFGSRIGRTVTAPSEQDNRPVRFAFVSCQNVQQGACNAYRRMIWEDKQAAASEQLGFVLHLGDFVYEIVWYPEDRPQGYYARRIRDIVRYANGEKHHDFHVPTTVDDYRALYRGYLLDPDLQDARAYLPFVYMWDNHEFSWRGWQTQENFGEGVIPAQTRKVAACQAWFEYQPSRAVRANTTAADQYLPPKVKNEALRNFDSSGLGMEPSNLAAINSLKLYRTLRWGRNVDLILTDNRSYRSEPMTDRPEFDAFSPPGFGGTPEEIIDILDAGRSYNGGQPPSELPSGDTKRPNPRKDSPPQSMLGAAQKAWFLGRLRESKAPWKLWGNSMGSIDWRVDYQNLPADFPKKWPAKGYASITPGDWGGYRTERAEILDFVHKQRIGGLALLAGDRHAFSAGAVSSALPPQRFEPAGLEFITGSISAPGAFEANEYGVPKDEPLRPLFVATAKDGSLAPTINLTIMHGVQASLAYAKMGDLQSAVKLSNPEIAPHLSFVDLGGHGYAVVTASPAELAVEFVCIPRPIERSKTEDGGPLAYRVTHRAQLWKPGERPKLERASHSGQLPLVP